MDTDAFACPTLSNSVGLVYVIKMNDAGKVAYVTKIWNSSWALRELGWA